MTTATAPLVALLHYVWSFEGNTAVTLAFVLPALATVLTLSTIALRQELGADRS